MAVDTIVTRGRRTTIGEFRCPLGHPAFRDSGPISDCIVVFPRTSVWIRHEGSKPFVADPTVATIYNRGQRYERFPIAGDGDRCDWFGVDDNLAREIAGTFDAAAGDDERPFRFEWAPSSPQTYVRQRALLRRAERGELDALAADEEVMGIVAEVLSQAYARGPERAASPRGGAKRRRALAAAACAELARAPHLNRSVQEIAAAIGASPFHLCRVFRACMGRTMHDYRAELRVRLAIEMLEDSRTAANLSRVAHDAGFASHSHFIRAARRYAGATPSALRASIA